MAPRADKDSYRTICDWGNWIFPFGDLFDDGDLREDHIRTGTMMDSLLCAFDNVTLMQIYEGEPLVRFHDGKLSFRTHHSLLRHVLEARDLFRVLRHVF